MGYQQQRLLQLLHQPHLVLQTRHLTPTQKSSNETFKPTWKSFPLCEEVPKLSSSDKEECFDTSARLRELLPQNAISAPSRSSGFRTQASSFDLYLLLKTNLIMLDSLHREISRCTYCSLML